jgi:uncharacterized protein (TIGR03437 family)
MDAVYTYFKKTILFLATALLMVLPGRADGLPSFVLNGNGVANLPVQLYANQSSPVTVTSSLAGTTEISFTAAVAYGAGDPQWLNPQYIPASGTTPTTLYLLPSYSGTVLHPAVITLHSAGAAADATITVTYTSNGSGGGGPVTATPSSVTLYAAAGATASPVTVSLTGNNGINFNIASLVTSPAGGSWLGASLTAGYGLSTPSSLTISANAYGLSNGYSYYGTVTVTPTNGAASTQIGVTLVVGSGVGTGNLTANPNYFSWSYTTNSGTYPSAVSVALTSAIGQTYYTASVDSSSTWLECNGTYPSCAGGYISSGISVGPNPTNMNSLTAGNYTGYVHVSDQNGNQALITVYLTVNGGTIGAITWSPNPVTITAAAGGSQQQLQVNFSSATPGTFTASISGSGLYVSGVSTTSTNPAAGSVIVYGNPYGLSSNTYSGVLSVTLTPTSGSQVSQTIPVTFTVGSGGATTSGSVTPTSLTFAYQTGTTVNGQTLPSQGVIVSGTGQFSVGSVTYTGSNTPSGVNWLTVSPAGGYAPGTISVSVSPTSLVPSTTPYTATLAVTPAVGASPITVSVSFQVTASPVLIAYPGSLNFNYTAGGTSPSWTVWLSASDNSAIPLTVATSMPWLSVSAPGGPATNTVVSIQGNNLSSLANGVYNGSVTVTATGAANSPVNIPVVLTVTGSTVTGGGLTLGNLSTFSATQGGAAPASQILSVGATTTTYYTASASSNGNWLSISPSGNLNTVSNPSLTVSVIQSALSSLTAAGSPYYGTITLVANGVTQQVQVTLVVSASGGGGGTGNVTASASALSFTYTVGGGASPSQTLQVTSASGSSPVSFTISSNATWLSAGVTNGTSLNTPVTFTVAIVTPVTLAPSSTPYSTTITITPNGGTVVTVPVTLTVQAAATVTATATPLSFTFQAGGADPSPQTVSVSGGGQSLGFTAQVTAGGNWLSVSPASGTTPTTGTATLTVTATPLEANLGVGTYLGTLLVSGTGTGTGSTSINVTLTVTAPLPTINSVVNAASFLKGAVSPGEIVTLFGTSMGPAAAAYATTDPSTGKLATTIGGVQVFFSGTAAPMIYASSTQISAIVPYEMAPIASPSVWVKYVGQTSNAYQLTSATTAPGLFTQNASGSGPGAILNQNLSLNGPANPAAKGSIVMVYMTGEGQTSPASITGAITLPNLPPPQVTPAPLLQVSVLINGQPALWTYAGEAPGLAAGLMQLNVQIPLTAQSGIPNSIQVYIGSNISQSGVTVSVQ